jgi:hypothetical protein
MPKFYVMRLTNTCAFASIEADNAEQAQNIADSLDDSLFAISEENTEVTNIVTES